MDRFIRDYMYDIDFGTAPPQSPLWYGQATLVVAAVESLRLCVCRDLRIFTWNGLETAEIAPPVPLKLWSAAADDMIASLVAGANCREVTYKYVENLTRALIALRAAEISGAQN